MDFQLTEEQQMLNDLVARFVRDELLPLESAVLAREAAGQGCTLTATEKMRLDAVSRDLGLWGLDAPKDIGGSDLPARCRQHNGVLDSAEGHPACMQLGGQEPVRSADRSRRSRCLAVSSENALNVFFPVDGLFFHVILLSLAARATPDHQWSRYGSSAAPGSAVLPPSVYCRESCATRHTPSWS